MRGYWPCLPLIEERFWNAIKENYRKDFPMQTPDYEIYMFPQTWANTALGFGGIGGQAISTACTTVICDIAAGYYGVFFNNGLGYVIKDPNELFMKDVHRCGMEERSKCSKYYRKEGI